MASHPGQQKRHSAEKSPVAWDPIMRALEEHNDWSRDLVEHSHDLLCVHDLEGQLLSVNPVPARVLGYSVEELLQKPMRDLIDPQFRDQFDAYLREIARTGESQGLMAVLTRSGERRIWEYHNTLRTEGVERPIVRGIAHDVTEQVRAAKALRVTNEQLLQTARERERMLRDLTLFRTLLDQSNDAIQVVDPETLRFLDVNERACAELGYSREELLSMSVRDIDTDPSEGMRAEVEKRLRESGFIIMERVHRRKNGTTFPVEVNLRKVRLDREYDVALSRNITARKQAEKALRESERRFRAVYERSPVGIALMDSATGRILQVNPKYCEITGRGEEELVGIDVRSITHPDDVGQTSEQLRQLAAEELASYEMEKRYVRPDGSVRWVKVQVVPMWGEGERGRWHMGLVQDITERKQSEEAIVTLVEEVCEAKKKLTEEKLYLEQEIDTELGFGEIIGKSKALQAVMGQVGKVAASDATVLLLGETGTGKELVARAIHRLSLRSGSSFIKLNCAAIPSGLLESELFGNEKGAFTGAVSKKIGRLELADKGTLFLDEIGEIPLALQPKLLRVLQDQEFERLGGIHTLKVDFRLIAATNRELADAVRENEFRSDLYYRLNVFPIRLPPLRERREDIRLLVEHFVQKCARRMNKSITSIPKRAVDALMGWDWPGNVRELENFIERSVILTQGSVLVAPLSELKPMTATKEEVVDESLEAAERDHILRALRESHGKIGGLRGAAMRLGLKRTTLQSKLKQLGIDPRAKPPEH
jgi:PAS domain S-box-containing protein